MAAKDNLGPQFDEENGFHAYDVEVSTHDDMKNGVLAKKWYGSQHKHHRVILSSEYGVDEGAAIAYQMAMGSTGGYPTNVHYRA